MAQSSRTAESEGYDEGYEITLDEALDLAKAHHMEGNFLLAERTYRDILKAAPDHFPTTHFLGVLLYQTTVYDEALIYLHKAVEAAPDDKQCWNNLGATYTDLRRFEDAMDAYDKALDIDSEFTEALNNQALAQWMMGMPEKAEKTARRALETSPKNMESKITLGIALSSQGKYEEAIDIWTDLSEKYPEIDKVWINWGNTLRDMGRFAESESKCRKALELSPDHPEAHNNLGNALRDRGRVEEALEHYRKATNTRPEYYDAHTNTAIALCDMMRFEEAATAARYAVAFKKDDPKANSALSLALRNMGEFVEARAASLRAIKAEPDRAEPYLDLADVNLMADIMDDAEAALQEAIKREPDSPRAYKKLADVKERAGDHFGGLDAINKAIEMAADMPLLWVKKAQLLQMENMMDGAFEAIDKAVELAPNWHLPYQVKAETLITVNENEQAQDCAVKAMSLNENVPGPYATLVSLKKIKSEDDEKFQKLLSLKENENKWGLSGASVLNYALADAYEQFKDYDLAFEHLKKANDFKRRLIPFNPQANVAVADLVRQRFSPEFLKKMEGKGFESDVPVFIVGMPRSGTTLTEQILSAHPDVFGAGELMEISKIRDRLGGLTEDNAREFGELYVQSVRDRDPDGKARRITDKMPGNFTNIGLISCILPNAKIIHCGRNAVDTCLSCYKQNFASGQYWSYNLEELAAEYNRYLDIMEHWRTVLPGRFLEIRYEDTVENFEEQARKLVDFVGLDWDDACLAPHKQKRTVLTASKAQVTQPVYKSSVQKWKRYEKHLKPLLDGLNKDLTDIAA